MEVPGIIATQGFRQLNQILRTIPSILGDGEKRVLKEEEQIATKLRYWLKNEDIRFDIDGTICSNTFGEYNTKPYEERISFINRL